MLQTTKFTQKKYLINNKKVPEIGTEFRHDFEFKWVLKQITYNKNEINAKFYVQGYG